MNGVSIGLDLGSRSAHQAVVLAGPERELFSKKLLSTPSSLKAFWEEIQCIPQARQGISVVMEASGMAWYGVACFFEQKGAQVYRVKAQQAQQLRRFLNRYTKTDELDALALAKMCYITPDIMEPLQRPDIERWMMKRLIHRRRGLVKERAREIQRFSEMIAWLLPSLESSPSKWMGKKDRKIMVKAFNVDWLKHMGTSRFKRWVKKRHPSMTDQKRRDLYRAVMDARELLGEDNLDGEAFEFEARHYIKNLNRLDTHIHEIEQRIQKIYCSLDTQKLLESISGIGALTAATLRAYFGSGKMFDNRSKLEAFVGFIPKVNQSGQSDKQGTSMRQDGPAELRQILYLATDRARQSDPQIAAAYYKEMVQKGKTHTQAICACVNRLLGRIWRVIRTEKPYELRDLEGSPISKQKAQVLIEKNHKIPEKIRRQRRNKRRNNGKEKSGNRENITGRHKTPESNDPIVSKIISDNEILNESEVLSMK